MGHVILTTSGGSAGNITGGSSSALSQSGNQNIGHFLPIIFNGRQIAGLVKMIPCNFVDCRASTPQAWCYSLPVFGVSGYATGASYQNDYSTFTISFSGDGSPKFTIQKCTSFFDGKKEVLNIWNNIADIDNSGKYGQYSPLRSIAGHPTYMSVAINWGLVLSRNGPGYYRILFQSCITSTSGAEGQTQAVTVNPFETPYCSSASNTWWSSVESIRLSFTIICGTTIYTIPAFRISPVQSGEMNSILNALNGYFIAQNLPFIAYPLPLDPTNEFMIKGTQFANQNGCCVTYEARFYELNQGVETEINNSRYTEGPSCLEGGNNGSGQTVTTCACGLQSPPFLLRAWDCMKAHGTVKFECWNQGTIGDVNNPGILEDLCGLSVYDSIRIQGFFGYNKYSYDELILEYGVGTSQLFGTIERVRDKAIPAYKFNSKPLPAWIHKQLATILMMADTIWASDYNINNADYFIQRKQVIKKGNYEPKYIETGKHFDLSLQEFGRRDKVSLEFLEGIQSIIKSTCCLTTVAT